MGSLWRVWPAVAVGLFPSCRLPCRLQCRVGPPPWAVGQGQPRRAARGGQSHGHSVRQNYSRECEEAINQQINRELCAYYVYLSMSYYFNRYDVGLRNFAKFYLEQSGEEQKHAEKLMQFQNQRGGSIVLYDIKKPHQDEWGSCLEAMEHALELEKEVNQSILNLHKLASEQNDLHLCEFLETNYLDEQVAAIRKLGDHITNLKKLGASEDGIGEYLFDKLSLGGDSY